MMNMQLENTITAEDIIKVIPPETLQKIILQALAGGQDNRIGGINRISISGLCKKQLQYAKAKEFSETTIRNYKLSQVYLREYSKKRGIEYADEITLDHADEFYNFLMNHKGFLKKDGSLSSRYIIVIYKTTKAMFAYAEKRDHIVKNPFENKVYPISQVTEYWTDEYVEKLLEAIDKHCRKNTKFKTKLKVLLTYTTGLRPGIIHGIKRKNVIIQGEEIQINTKCKVPKSSKIQRITTPILNNRVKAMIRELIADLDNKGIDAEQYILCKGNSPKIGYLCYRSALVRVCKKDGLHYIRPHGAKHGFITKMAQNGFTAEEICKLTGNRTPRMIQEVYMHLQLRDVKDRAKKIIENI